MKVDEEQSKKGKFRSIKDTAHTPNNPNYIPKLLIYPLIKILHKLSKLSLHTLYKLSLHKLSKLT